LRSAGQATGASTPIGGRGERRTGANIRHPIVEFSAGRKLHALEAAGTLEAFGFSIGKTLRAEQDGDEIRRPGRLRPARVVTADFTQSGASAKRGPHYGRHFSGARDGAARPPDLTRPSGNMERMAFRVSGGYYMIAGLPSTAAAKADKVSRRRFSPQPLDASRAGICRLHRGSAMRRFGSEIDLRDDSFRRTRESARWMIEAGG